MSTYHYHNVYCPHCGDVAFQPGCRRTGCSFAHAWMTEAEAKAEAGDEPLYVDECPHCGETFWYTDGRDAPAPTKSVSQVKEVAR